MNASSKRSIRQISLLLVAEAWWELLQVKMRLRVPFGRAKWLTNALCLRPGRNDRSAMDRLNAAVNRASEYHLAPMRCLDRSLALVRMLRRRGIATTLRIGCRRQGEALDFHAWVVDSKNQEPNSKNQLAGWFLEFGS